MDGCESVASKEILRSSRLGLSSKNCVLKASSLEASPARSREVIFRGQRGGRNNKAIMTNA